MAADTKTSMTQVYEVYIKATPQAIWDAITTPEWTAQYGYKGATTYDLRPGGAFQARATADMRKFGMPEVVVDGEVIEADPPQAARADLSLSVQRGEQGRGLHARHLGDRAVARRLLAAHRDPRARGRADDGRHGRRASSPEQGAGGWSWILSDMKSLLETGSTLAG